MQTPVYQSFPMLGPARAQVWSYSPYYRRPRHFHAEPELNLIVAGRAVFGVGRDVVEVGRGELLAFVPGQDHALLWGSHDLEFFAIGMRASLSSDVLRARQRQAFAAPLRVRLTNAAFDALLARTTSVAQQDGVDGRIAELWEAAQHARTTERHSEPEKSPHLLTLRALESINADPELRRSALARKSATCPSEVSRHFHRDVGTTLVRYRARIRLLRFIERVDTGASLGSAALDAGFGSYSQCHRVFTGTLGCAPSDFFHTVLRREMEDRFEP